VNLEEPEEDHREQCELVETLGLFHKQKEFDVENFSSKPALKKFSSEND
jgi:hypothetical protein